MFAHRTWRAYPEIAVPDELQALAGGYPLVSQALARRGFLSVQDAHAFLDPEAYTPTPPTALPGLEQAAGRLAKAIKFGERICVWGDFDVDGQTATTILFSALRNLGADVRYYIPIRAQESHGLNLNSLQKQMDAGLDLILTCDTGIAAQDAVQTASQRGIDTVITDHHALPSALPEAYAIVNPKLLDDPNHPLTALPGVGVAYKLAEELYHRHSKSLDCREFLDLAALGIVADVASLVGETRYLLQLGLRQLQKSTRVGLRALMEAADLQPGSITEETISFVLAPRLNAVGRLSDANPMVDFFTTSDYGRARLQAQMIESLNAQRKLLTDQVFKAAMSQIERQPDLLESKALVLSYPTWPAGVIGIIASRLVEYFHKPVVLLSSPPGEIARGSARSIPGVDITQAIATQAHLLGGFGGHPMAAGLSIQPDRIDEFRQGLSHAVVLQTGIAQQTPAETESILQFDAYLPFSALTPELVSQLEKLSPFGPGNPAPVFVAQGLTIQSQKTIGQHAEHWLVRLVDPANTIQEVIWWQGAGFSMPEGPFDLAYSVHSRDFKGQPSIQVVWIESRPVIEAETTLQAQPVAVERIDHRHVTSPVEILNGLLSKSDLQVWREGPVNGLVNGSDRFHLSPTHSLVIWTIPPGRGELAAVLEQTRPETVYFFGIHPGLDQPAPFLERLAGLVKYTLRHPDQPVDLSSLAVALAHRISTTRTGLEWLEAKGLILIQQVDENTVLLKPGQGQSSPDLKQVENRLRQALEETTAFRSYYLRADLNVLV